MKIIEGLLIGYDDNNKLKNITLMNKRFHGIEVFYGNDRLKMAEEIFKFARKNDYALKEKDVNYLKTGTYDIKNEENK